MRHYSSCENIMIIIDDILKPVLLYFAETGTNGLVYLLNYPSSTFLNAKTETSKVYELASGLLVEPNYFLDVAEVQVWIWDPFAAGSRQVKYRNRTIRMYQEIVTLTYMAAIHLTLTK